MNETGIVILLPIIAATPTSSIKISAEGVGVALAHTRVISTRRGCVDVLVYCVFITHVGCDTAAVFAMRPFKSAACNSV